MVLYIRNVTIYQYPIKLIDITREINIDVFYSFSQEPPYSTFNWLASLVFYSQCLISLFSNLFTPTHQPLYSFSGAAVCRKRQPGSLFTSGETMAHNPQYTYCLFLQTNRGKNRMSNHYNQATTEHICRK